jgi:hypothetical protein
MRHCHWGQIHSSGGQICDQLLLLDGTAASTSSSPYRCHRRGTSSAPPPLDPRRGRSNRVWRFLAHRHRKPLPLGAVAGEGRTEEGASSHGRAHTGGAPLPCSCRRPASNAPPAPLPLRGKSSGEEPRRGRKGLREEGEDGSAAQGGRG